MSAYVALPIVLALSTASAHYARGVEALAAKDAEVASRELQACVEVAPHRIDCWWELGWARWLAGDWEAVVEAWETVERLAPAHPEVGTHLPQAQAQVRLQAELAEGRAAAPETAPAPVAKGTTLTLRAVGDVMLGTDFPKGYLPPDDGAHMLTKVRTLLEDADVTFANLEGPLCDSGSTRKCRAGGNCYAFRTPSRYGRYLAEAGVDMVSTANNHSGDFGEGCRRETESTLDGLGIAWSGPPGSIASLERKGLRIGLVAFHTSPACNHLNDTATAVKLVAAAAARHDLVVVSFHGGAEGSDALHVPHGPETFYGENRGHLRHFARAVIDAGADLVIGHGPHVPRGFELYQDRLIAYSLGNFATYGRFSLGGAKGVGLVLEATLDAAGRFVGGRIIPTRQVGRGVPEPDDRAEAVDLIRRLTDADFPETALVIARDGGLASQQTALVETKQPAPTGSDAVEPPIPAGPDGEPAAPEAPAGVPPSGEGGGEAEVPGAPAR